MWDTHHASPLLSAHCIDLVPYPDKACDRLNSAPGMVGGGNVSGRGCGGCHHARAGKSARNHVTIGW
eukprot:6212246-Pleurochrysis_carterae.AAC.4